MVIFSEPKERQQQFADKVCRWIVGVDLGQSADPTAISVLRHTVTPLETWSEIPERNLYRQDRVTKYDVLHLERLQLGMPYPDQIQYLIGLLARPSLATENPLVVVDETGVGRPVADLADSGGLKPMRVSITSGTDAVYQGGRRWHVAKGILISGLDAALHCGELRVATAIRDAGALADELKDFQRSVSAAGRATYAARTGKHDDLVLSVAIALWAAQNRRTASREELR